MLRFLGRRNTRQRVVVIGLDCASPSLVFDEFKDDLPHLKQLMAGGSWGLLHSSTPCITVPAWSSMMSSCDPGVLGIYGFRNRADYSYSALSTADASAVKQPRVWDILSQHNLPSLVFNVPQTYPVSALNGHLVSCFLTPGNQSQFAYPAILKQELLKREPSYAFDVNDYRRIERHELLERIIEMTEQQYRAFEYALTHKEWRFAMHVNIGVDRIHHTFWRYHDPQHRLHEPNSPFRNAIRDYYKRVDSWIGRLLAHLDNDVTVLVVSDHGVKRMDGAVAINEWLRQNGWLVLKSEPTEVTRFSHELVDWSKTQAWSTGGYYGRIFFNVQGREPQGIIPQNQYHQVRAELAEAIRNIPDADGKPMHNQVFIPEQIYQSVNGIPPDLMVYFGDLHWRAVGSIGYGSTYTMDNDTGPDDANHAQEGMYIHYNPRQKGAGKSSDYQLMDIAPTILDHLKIPIPANMQGRVMQF